MVWKKDSHFFVMPFSQRLRLKMSLWKAETREFDFWISCGTAFGRVQQNWCHIYICQHCGEDLERRWWDKVQWTQTISSWSKKKLKKTGSCMLKWRTYCQTDIWIPADWHVTVLLARKNTIILCSPQGAEYIYLSRQARLWWRIFTEFSIWRPIKTHVAR